ncbi:hypothetical protein BpHYR1_049670 [Brachionus plicatilis]|uniref:Uncharacterized protein n=1 Tax=Brachionus plicatilis TaxID=10195 RepID=A0A3M7R5F5_BRAPC|nr:hypothetical protein BpHYR1_049670 [Brachionus plicatilis]
MPFIDVAISISLTPNLFVREKLRALFFLIKSTKPFVDSSLAFKLILHLKKFLRRSLKDI